MIWNEVATILRKGTVSINEIGEKTQLYDEVGSTKIRFFSNSTDYIRTQIGFVKSNGYKGIIPYKTNIVQGDKLRINNNEYLVTGINDDGMKIFLNIDLE